jgi:hypothetical protein
MNMQSPESAEQQFFTALIEADVASLDRVLADDFLLIDVLTGSEVSKSALLDVVNGGQLKFQRIDCVEHRVRMYTTSAVITGRSEMSGRFADQTFQTQSRYTHVFVAFGDHWRLVSAQGTQIAASPNE